MLKRLINFVLGYINVEIEGYYIEKFINMCKRKEIFLWGIRKQKVTVLKAKIAKIDIEQAKSIAQENQCIIKIKNQKGFPGLWKRYKKRKIFIISFFLLLGMVYLSSKFIWNIEI